MKTYLSQNAKEHRSNKDKTFSLQTKVNVIIWFNIEVKGHYYGVLWSLSFIIFIWLILKCSYLHFFLFNYFIFGIMPNVEGYILI